MSTRDARQPAGRALEEPIREPRVGSVVGTAEDGSPRVDYPGNTRGPLVARVSAGIDADTLARAADQRQQALLLFENGDPGLPILVTLLAAPSATPLIDAVLAEPLPLVPEEALVDGERVVIRGQEEVVLECGKASITLRRDGKIVLRGADILTVASGVQRIKGGKVQIN
ncbi:DUF6484 domain-containing protein [Hyalangium versicolor]|uniref:DUF6484 domain-containing protein n=1 Tax=Hyalangium versicolor TaxID=2861190 RepID=UPI001CCE70D1|nr:DUF6484 domain-containing protein [Hyalangium versicolor]